MTREELLKNHILSEYKSIRAFALSIGMPTSTIDNVLKRGMGNSSVNTIIEICAALKIDLEELYSNLKIIKKSDIPTRNDHLMPVAAHSEDTSEENMVLLNEDAEEL